MATPADLRFILNGRIKPNIDKYIQTVKDFEKHIQCCGSATFAEMHEVEGLLQQAHANTDFLRRKLNRIVGDIERRS